MNLGNPFEVVTPTLDGEVLTVLSGADSSFTPGEISRILGDVTSAGVRKVLNRLTYQGIVEKAQTGKAFSYRLNRNHLAAEAIVALANQRNILIQRLTQHVEKWESPPVFAAIFGSAARANMRLDSDIDLFVAYKDGNPDIDYEVNQLSMLTAKWTGNPTNPITMSESEVKENIKPVDGSIVEPLLQNIAEDGIVFYGRPTWLQNQIRKARRET